MDINSFTKYGDDSMFESLADNYIFFPIGDTLMPFFKKLNLTANQITLMSTLSTFVSCYYLYHNNIKLFSIYYFTGYLLDCIDGRYARKYKMTSLLGMVLDSTSDIISNIVLFIVLSKYYKLKNFRYILIILLFLCYKFSISFGLNEAISSYKNTGNDNFYEYREKMLKDFGTNPLKKILKNIYLMIQNISYQSYRKTYKKYDSNKINERLVNNREFGPGNMSIVVLIAINYLLN